MKKQVSKMTDKELDDFFKKSSSDPEIPYDPKDWESFEKLLADNKGAPSSNGIRWTLLVPLLLVIYIIAVWMTVSNSNAPVEAGSNSQIDTTLVQVDTTSVKVNTNIFLQNTGKISGLNPTTNELVESAEDLIGQTSNDIPGSFKQRLTSTTKSKKVEKHLIPRVSREGSKWKVIEEFNQVRKINKPIKINNDSLVQFRDQASPGRKNKIALLLMASPDFSAVKFNHMPSSGRNLGIGLEYFLGERWSISLGAIHDQKTYRQGKGYWEGYNNAHQSLVGDCWILEVPVDFKFYPIKRSKDNWFISTGLSSYFMLKEKYSLFYDNSRGDTYTREMEIKGNNQHVFGIWNIGFGYERKLGKKFSVQAEPYYRLPLVGIGEGNLNLKSMGIFFGIKYYPSKQRINF
jgi:hypothetical protein